MWYLLVDNLSANITILSKKKRIFVSYFGGVAPPRKSLLLSRKGKRRYFSQL